MFQTKSTIFSCTLKLVRVHLKYTYTNTTRNPANPPQPAKLMELRTPHPMHIYFSMETVASCSVLISLMQKSPLQLPIDLNRTIVFGRPYMEI